jgi:type I restriction enzyme R subunit
MVGRGTRLCKDLYGPGEDKQNFYIFDFCQNLEFFAQNPDFAEGTTTEPLSTRLFKARLDVIAELDKKLKRGEQIDGEEQNGDTLTDSQLRHDVATILHAKVMAMNVDNFVVRPQRKSVERFADAKSWHVLGTEDFHELASRVAGLPSKQVDDDEEAKRFDMLVLRTQLAVLQAKPDFANLKEKIQTIASALEEQMAIPAIKAEMVLIQAVASDDWWEDITVPMLETVRRRLRALVKLIPKGQKKVIYTNFEDELGETATIDLPQVTAGLNMGKFREKARQFLRAHESHLSLQRLRRNQPLTPTDLTELEKMLLEAGGTQSQIDEAKEQSHGLGIFIRSLVGLDREAAIQAFSDFINGTTSTANQIEFVNLIVQELTQNGVMEADRLFQSPFTDLNAQGPLGIFPATRVSQIVEVLNQIRERAVA